MAPTEGRVAKPERYLPVYKVTMVYDANERQPQASPSTGLEYPGNR